MFEKYGVEHNFENGILREKSIQTQVDKYGKLYCQTEEFKERYRKICQERYGVDNVFQLEEIKEKSKQTLFNNYGVEYSTQSPEIREKISRTMFQNGTCKTSSQQIEIFNMLQNNNYKVELNFPISALNLDIGLFINDMKIDIEYDGWKWHTNFQKDRKRDEFLKSQGWKILRIKSGKKTPSFEQLINAIQKLIETDRTFTQIILDDWKVEKVI